MDPTLPLDAFGSISSPASAPLDTSSAIPGASANAAADPSSGAGWKQTAQGIGNLFGNTIGSLRANNGVLSPAPNPQQGPATAKPGQPGATPGAPGAPGGSGNPTLAQQAQALLQKGILSQEQYQKIMASIGGSVPSTGMPEMIASQGTPAMGGASPFTAAMNPVNGPSPISPAWGG